MRKITKLLLCMVLVIAVACSAMTVFAQEQTTNVAENVQTGQQYADLDKALLDAAQDGQTVKLLQNANANVLTVYENVTLDLNGWELSASYASVYGHVVDNSEANSGVLNVGTRMLIQANNKQLPVKTDKGYQFVEIVGFNTAWMNDTTFVFQPLFEASAHEMLKNGVADTDVSIQVEVTWRPSEGSEHLDSRIFKYGDNFVTQFVNSYNPATGKYGKMFTLTLVNPQNYVDLSCNTKVVAKAGVAFSPVKVSNAAKIGETEYATVQDALDAAQDGQTVTLLENVKATKYLDVYSASETGRSVTLDLNGKTISWGEDYKYQWYPLVFVGVNQTLTIENGSIVADQHVAVGAYGHVNLISVDVSVLTASEDEQAVCIWDWSEEDKYYPDYQHNVTGSGSITGGSITGGLLIEGTTQLSADAGFDKLYINTETGYGKAVLPEGYGLVAENDYFVNLHAHIEEAVAGKAATCTETGLTEGKKCTVCGTTTVEQEKIDALGHKEETVAGKAATCTETGLTDGKKCTVCGVTTVAQTEIPATGEHNYVNGTCTGCGDTELVEIDYSGTYYIAAIRSSGNYWYMTSDLGTASTKRYTAVDSGVKELPTNITSGEKDLAFTLIKQEDGTYIIMANGVESTDCYVAWSSGNSGYFAKTGRKLTVDMNDDGTFLIHFTGDEERYLSLNSTSGSNYFAFYKGTQSQMLSLIPATVCEHEWNDGEITTSATCTEQGVKTYTCVNGCTKTEPVEPLGHSVTSGTCSVCGKDVGGATVPTVVLEITKDDFNTTSYAANNNTKTENSYSYTSNQVMQQSGTMQWQKSKGYITITSNVFTKLELKATAGTYTVTVGGKTVTGTTSNGVTTYDLTGLTGVVKISVSSSATGKVEYIKFYK